MGKNILVSDSVYQPYSYEELVRPYEKYGEAYREQELALSEMEAKAAKLEYLKQAAPKSQAAITYDNYQKELESVSGSMINGLNANSRRNVLNLRTQYQTRINPIEKAIGNIEKLSQEQRTARDKDGTVMFDKEFSMDNIDEIMSNPTATYKSLSGNEIAKRSSELFTQMGNSIVTDPQYQHILNNSVVQQYMTNGYNMNEIMLFMMNDGSAPPEMLQLYENLYTSFGLDAFPTEVQDRANQFILSGAIGGLGKDSYTTMNNMEASYQGQLLSNINNQIKNDMTQEDYEMRFNPEDPRHDYRRAIMTVDYDTAIKTGIDPSTGKAIKQNPESIYTPGEAAINKALYSGNRFIDKKTGDHYEARGGIWYRYDENNVIIERITKKSGKNYILDKLNNGEFINATEFSNTKHYKEISREYKERAINELSDLAFQ